MQAEEQEESRDNFLRGQDASVDIRGYEWISVFFESLLDLLIALDIVRS